MVLWFVSRSLPLLAYRRLLFWLPNVILPVPLIVRLPEICRLVWFPAELIKIVPLLITFEAESVKVVLSFRLIAAPALLVMLPVVATIVPGAVIVPLFKKPLATVIVSPLRLSVALVSSI